MARAWIRLRTLWSNSLPDAGDASRFDLAVELEAPDPECTSLTISHSFGLSNIFLDLVTCSEMSQKFWSLPQGLLNPQVQHPAPACNYEPQI